METRVVILLAGGNFANARFNSKEEASKFIAEWEAICIENLGKQPCEYHCRVMRYVDLRDGSLVGAVSAPFIIGMYIAEATPADRMADSYLGFLKEAKRKLNEGDEWKENG